MSPTNMSRAMVAGAIGNLLEWYDFTVYGYFAASIGRAFFPQQNQVAQVLSAFGIFAVGFLMRPVGGALFGYIGDHFGRRIALSASVVAMALPTFLIGVLPGYAVLGIAAPLLLTLLRMIQGLSVGGEYTTSVVFLVERARPERRGVVGATANLGALTGILAGSATGAVLETLMSAQTVQEWGWRVPFWIGLSVGLAGLVLRRGLKEEPVDKSRQGVPPLVVFRQHWRLLLYLAFVSAFGAVGFYLIFVYIVSWLQFADGVAPAQALSINTISMLLLLPTEVGMAALSDRIGGRPVLLWATGLTIVFAWPLFRLMHGPEQWMILSGQIGFVLLVGGYYGCLPAFMVEAVPAPVRCTAIALGYNVSLGLIGGVSPMVATWLVYRTDNNYTPAFMIMAAAAISFLVLAHGFGLRVRNGESAAGRDVDRR